MLPNHCEHCQSKNIKVSSYYEDYYFCLECKDGGLLKKTAQKLLEEFEALLNQS